MSEKVPQEDPRASFAKRIDPKKEPLTPEQVAFIRRVELEQWKKNSQKLRGRNIFTGLAIGGLVLGIYNLSLNAEKFLDELEEEAKVARTRASKTSAN
ncbi:hypothetical protein AOXY_G23025 [Acipenser oxyrinchus oxyrinchus]|uniref:Cytochrome c oxidase assembly factor 3 n=1 Tax=Acipenser oxyrinchus oxyrinchus TaxID=40147 RepID=A0AAD8FZT7_ACIOX|nr:hypothetical protein AOXY_G23025 [Acipenser oxyrinchus oxyrinchus]